MDDVGDCLRALSDETRRSVVELLLRYNFCAGALAKRLAISEAAISQHIKVLKKCGLIKSEKKGYFIVYEINRKKLDEMANYFSKLSSIKRLPCDPTMENCEPKKRCLCHTDKHCRGCDCHEDCKNCNRTKEMLKS